MNVGFFEVEKWAISFIKERFPHAQIFYDHLSIDNIDKHKDLEIVASFIYSDLSKKTLSQLTKLKLVTTMSTGYDHIDIDYCKERNITVCNVPNYGERTVAEHTFGLILTLTRKLYESIDRTKRGNFSLSGLRGTDLYGKTIGIVGLGSIGSEVLKIARSFGMRVLVCTHNREEKRAREQDFQYVLLEELLNKSDIITLHLPLNDETYHLINKKNIFKFKKGSYLINTARGGLIEDEALLEGLNKGILEGVGLDVLEQEVVLKEEAQLLSSTFRASVDYENLVYDHIILHHPKVVVTPHNAFNSNEALGAPEKTVGLFLH